MNRNHTVFEAVFSAYSKLLCVFVELLLTNPIILEVDKKLCFSSFNELCIFVGNIFRC